MIPANFDYIQADSAEAAIEAIAEHGDEEAIDFISSKLKKGMMVF